MTRHFLSNNSLSFTPVATKNEIAIDHFLLCLTNSVSTASGDFSYHFGGRSGHTSLRPWYVKTGLTYMSSEGEWEKRMNLLLVPRLGREFNVTPEFGVALEAGIMLMLMDKNTAKKERTDAVTGDLDLIGSGPVLPSIGFKLFYRLY